MILLLALPSLTLIATGMARLVGPAKTVLVVSLAALFYVGLFADPIQFFLTDTFGGQ